ncbi:hypothetical protein [Pontibacter roseus]|uniref:hypothetical protein n=1 Tax=Pontibacter roseus TaxID=336989 RepID=UPI0003A4C155|nr:hypothetical protein [Pontibacter roseus]
MRTFIPIKSLLLLGLYLICSQSVYSQEDKLKSLKADFEIYANKTLQEKLYMHTDKSAYLAGETMWFKLYNVDAISNSPINMSKVAYVEVLDKENNPVLQTKVSMSQGNSGGSLFLPATLNSGNYVIRAYTNWMKNFSSDYFFEKPLTIVNTFKKLGLGAEDLSVTYDVQFFPEGGQLVNGLESRVAFKAVDKHGKGLKFEGIVLNQRNDTVAHVHTHKFGIGNFYMTPAQGDTYKAVLHGPEGQIITRELPKAYDRGMVMHLTEAGPEELRVTVRAIPATAGLEPQVVYLLAHTRHEAKVADMRLLDHQGEATFAVAKSALGEGISHLTVFNGAKQPLAERLYFKRPQQGLRIQAATDRKEFALRAPVDLKLEANSLMGTAAVADMSVAVYKVDSLNAYGQQGIMSYLWLTSDLKGSIETPDYYFTERGAEADIALDNLMLTHGWRRFKWENVLQNGPVALAHVPEYGGHLIRAKVTDAKTGKPAQRVLTYLSSPSRMVRLYNSRSNQQGEVLFDVKNYYGSNDILLQAAPSGDTTYKVQVENPFSAAAPSTKLPVFDLSERLQQHLQASSIHLQVQNHHVPPASYRLSAPVTDSAAFYGKPDRVFLLDAYTRFPVMEEVMREYVQPVMVRKRQGKYHFYVLDGPRNTYMEEEPLVLLDGIPVLDTDKIMAVDPRKVERLEVISRKYFHGTQDYSGVVSFITYAGDMAGLEIDPTALLVEYEGMQLQREFYSPKYDSQEQAQSKLPDLRNLLYWSSNLQTDREGKRQLRFYTSDQEGTYVVEVQGLTKDGKAGSGRYTFEVKQRVL